MADSVLIPRYPGAKSSRTKYPVWDGQVYDTAIVPFAGSGRWCIPTLQQGHVRSLVVADADPAVRAVWEQYQFQSAECLEHSIDEWIEHLILRGAREVFDELVEIIDKRGQLVRYTALDYPAAKILIHKLCFGGNVRSNSQGKLNISLRRDWAEAIHDWHYELPWCPPNRSIDIYADWSECFQRPFTGKTIAFIDPPYYAPGNGPRVKGGMSKAYSVHGGNPNDSSVLELFTGAVQAAVDAGCDRIVATNYWGHWLQMTHYGPNGEPQISSRVEWVEYTEVTDFMRGLGFEWFHDLGPLQSMNNINFNPDKAGTTEQRTVRHEGWWELGGTRQHGRVEQMNLLEAIVA